jgi:hypothetical protein
LIKFYFDLFFETSSTLTKHEEIKPMGVCLKKKNVQVGTAITNDPAYGFRTIHCNPVITRLYRENKPERPRIPHVFPAYPESKRINQPPVSFPTTLIRLLDSGHPTTSRSIILLYRERRRVQGFNTHTP